MKWYLIISLLALMACSSPQKTGRVYTETFTTGRIDTLRKIDGCSIDTLQTIQAVILGIEFGSDSITTYNQLRAKLQNEPNGSLMFTFPSPQIAMAVKPYFYDNKLWKLELYEISSAKRDNFDVETIGHNALITVIQKYYPDEEADNISISTVMDIPGEVTSCKTKDNLLIAVRSHSTQGVTIGYIDLYLHNRINADERKKQQEEKKELAKDL